MKFISVLVLALSLAGCSTIDSLKPGGGRSIKVEGATYAKLWKISNKVVSQQLTIVSSDEKKGAIKAEKGVGVTTWGEVVGVFITPAQEGAKEYTIEVVSKKRSTMQITGQDWTETIVAGIKAEL